jgi:hypothetical protein
MGNSPSNQYGGNPELFRAIQENNIDIVRKLITEDKTIINNRWRNDSTPLIEATEKNLIPLIGFFIQNGAQINLQDANGYTALHHAVSKNTPESYALIKFLLENKADPKLRSNAGRLPIELLGIEGEPLPYQRQIIEELQKYTRYTFSEKLAINPTYNRENIYTSHQFLTNISQKMVGTDIDSTIYSSYNGDNKTILNFLTEEGRDALIFLLGKTQEGISASQILKNINDGFLVYYECNKAGGVFPNPDIVYTEPFVRLPLTFPTYIPYDDAKLMMSQHQFWEIVETPIVLNFTVSENFIKSKDAVGADHCQENTAKRVYRLRPYIPIIPFTSSGP